jgi:hypothetical protein
MTAAAYHAGPCPGPELSNSLIKVLLIQSPLHAKLKHPKLNPAYVPYESDRFDLGTAAHSILLEGGEAVVVVDAEDWRTKAAKEAREAAHAQGKAALLERHYRQAMEMAALARDFVSRTYLGDIMQTGVPEATVVWQEGGVWAKARPDLLATSICLDYKTTSATSPADFMRSSMVGFGYDIQDSWYRRGLAATGHPCEFVFLVQEDSAPYTCYLVQCSESMRELADRKITRALRMWSECLARDEWPAYGHQSYIAQAPMWAMTEEMGRE